MLELAAGAKEEEAPRLEKPAPPEKENIELELNGLELVVASPKCELLGLKDEETFIPNVGDEQDPN